MFTLECGLFDRFDPDGTSNESFMFMSTHCIPNSQQAGILLFLLSFASVFTIIFFGLFLRSMVQNGFNAKNSSVSSRALFLSFLYCLLEMFTILGKYLGFTGVLRTFSLLLPFLILLFSVIYLLKRWFQVVAFYFISTKTTREKHSDRVFNIINGVYQVTLTLALLLPGLVNEVENPALYNMAMGIAFIYAGAMLLVLGGLISYVAWKVVKLLHSLDELKGSEPTTNTKHRMKVINTIQRYSRVQTGIALSVGLSAIGVGVWRFALLTQVFCTSSTFIASPSNFLGS